MRPEKKVGEGGTPGAETAFEESTLSEVSAGKMEVP